MIKYPRYTREQNLACKLTDDDIQIIRQLKKQKVPVKIIAKRFKVSVTAITYWLWSPEKRKEMNRQQYRSSAQFHNKRDENVKAAKHAKQRRSKKRKYEIMPAFRKYSIELSKKHQAKKHEHLA